MRRKQTTPKKIAFDELDPHILGGLRPKQVREAKTDVWQAAHLLFVVRWADFSGKRCNCATFRHLIITLLGGYFLFSPSRWQHNVRPFGRCFHHSYPTLYISEELVQEYRRIDTYTTIQQYCRHCCILRNKVCSVKS